MRHLIVFIAFFSWNSASSIVFAQNTFQRLYSLPDSTGFGGTRVAVAPNGDIYTAGSSNTLNEEIGAVVLKLDQAGQLLWSRKWNPDLNQIVNITDIEATNTGGAIVSVNTYLTSALRSDIVALSSTGDVLWTKTLDNNADWGIDNITAISDGFLLIGYFPGVASRTAIVKINESGTVLWSKQFGNIEVTANAIFEDTNKDLFIPGRSGLKGALLHLNSNGDLIKNTDITENGTDVLGFFTGCVKTIQDSLIVVGYDLSGRIVMVKTDKNGNVGAAAYLSVPGNPLYGIGTASDASGNLYLAIYEDASLLKPIFAKFSSTLAQIWVNRYANDGPTVAASFYAMAPSKSDGGFVLSGYRVGSSNGGVPSAFIAKSNANGEIQGACCPQQINIGQSGFKGKSEPGNLSQIAGLALVNFNTTLSETPVLEADLCTTEEMINPDSSVVCPGNCINFSMRNAQSGKSYQWSFQGASPDTSGLVNPGNICYNSKGDYIALLKENGCVLDTAFVKVDNPQDQFPNAFAPNGFNKTFKPLISCEIEDYHLEVFNRWGDLVYESFDRNEAWDGEVNGKPAPMDVYVYRVQFFAVRDGERKLVYEAKKELTLIR